MSARRRVATRCQGLEVVADRFLRVGARVFDLATAEEVVLRRAALPAGDAVWKAAEHWFAVAHPHLVRLVDFEPRLPVPFLALALPAAAPSWSSGRAGGHEALGSVTRFLTIRNLALAGPPELRDLDGRCVVVPENLETTDDAASRRVLAADARHAPARVVATILERRDVEDRIVDLLVAGAPGGVRVVRMEAPAGAGFDSFWHSLARGARLHGYVPVCLDAVRRWPEVEHLLEHRHLLIVARAGSDDSGADDARLAGWLLRLGLASPRPHVVLRQERSAAAAGLRLTSLPGPILDRLVWLDGVGSRQRQRLIDRALQCAHGQPGRFVSALRGEPLRLDDSGVTVARVHETASHYGVSASAIPAQRSAREVVSLVSTSAGLPAARARAGFEKLARGEFAAGERLVRQAIGGFARRRHARQAGEAGLTLGRALYERGRVAQAHAVAMAARADFERASASARSVEAAILLGACRLDEGRLVAAEATLRAAAGAADQLEDGPLAGLARAGVARSLFWQGRLLEADALLDDTPGSSSPATGPSLRLRARIAQLRRRFDAACEGASRALAWARRREDVPEVASSLGVLAGVQAGLGDDTSAARYLSEALAAAKRAHAPMRAVRSRLVVLEALSDRPGAAFSREVAAGLRRGRWSQFAGLLRARTRLALAEACPDAPAAADWRAAATDFVRVHGVRTLEFMRRKRPDMQLIDDFAELLRVVQEPEEEADGLQQVCRLLRDRLSAAGVAVVGLAPATPLALAGPVSTTTSSLGSRVLETGIAIGPSLGAEGLEAGAPVRSGRHAIAALVCRWPAGVTTLPPGAEALMAAACAASAVLVRAILDRRVISDRVNRPHESDLIGISPAIAEVRRAILRAGAAPFPVLIHGDSGSGKELVARAIHRASARRDRRLCTLNCAALTDELVEAELFGHARGAFTGAVAERPGLFEEAHGGTLFLDEVGELSARAQAKLLRALQEGEIRRVGENVTRRADVRVIAATNRSLRVEVEARRFRHDLLYRLDVVNVTVPALRERPEDIPILAAHFWKEATDRTGSRATLDPALVEQLARYSWPGNVRELQNVMAALAVHAPRRGRVLVSSLPPALVGAVSVPGTTLDTARQNFERRFVGAALARAGGHRGRAAAELGLSRQGLAKVLVRLQIATGERGP